MTTLHDRRLERRNTYIAERDSFSPNPDGWAMKRYRRWQACGGRRWKTENFCHFFRVVFLWSYLRGAEKRFTSLQNSVKDLIFWLTPITLLSGWFGWLSVKHFKSDRIQWWLIVSAIIWYALVSLLLLVDEKIYQESPTFEGVDRPLWGHTESLPLPILLVFFPGIICWATLAAIWRLVSYPVVRRVAKQLKKRDGAKHQELDDQQLAVGSAILVGAVLAVAMVFAILAGLTIYFWRAPWRLVWLAGIVAGAACGVFLAAMLSKFFKKRAQRQQTAPEAATKASPKERPSSPTHHRPATAVAKTGRSGLEILEMIWDWIVSRKWKICPIVRLPTSK